MTIVSQLVLLHGVAAVALALLVWTVKGDFAERAYRARKWSAWVLLRGRLADKEGGNVEFELPDQQRRDRRLQRCQQEPIDQHRGAGLIEIPVSHHEDAHVPQSQQLGFFYIPAYVAGFFYVNPYLNNPDWHEMHPKK